MQEEDPILNVLSKTGLTESFETTVFKDSSKQSDDGSVFPILLENKFKMADNMLDGKGFCEIKSSYMKSDSFSQSSVSSSNSYTTSISMEEEEESCKFKKVLSTFCSMMNRLVLIFSHSSPHYNTKIVDAVDKQDDNVESRLPRSLNAYNYFFRDEKENLMNGVYGPDGSFPPPSEDWSEGKKWKLLLEHWFADPLKGRRKHRKKAGRTIPFLT
jgi:hypothetical protein